MVSVHSKVMAMLRAEGISIADYDVATACLSQCVAPTWCLEAYGEIHAAYEAAARIAGKQDHPCLITRNSYGSIGFRFDPGASIKAGDVIDDGQDGKTEVLAVI